MNQPAERGCLLLFGLFISAVLLAVVLVLTWRVLQYLTP